MHILRIIFSNIFLIGLIIRGIYFRHKKLSVDQALRHGNLETRKLRNSGNRVSSELWKLQISLRKEEFRHFFVIAEILTEKWNSLYWIWAQWKLTLTILFVICYILLHMLIFTHLWKNIRLTHVRYVCYVLYSVYVENVRESVILLKPIWCY